MRGLAGSVAGCGSARGTQPKKLPRTAIGVCTRSNSQWSRTRTRLRLRLAALHWGLAACPRAHVFGPPCSSPFAVEPDQEALRQKLAAARALLPKVQIPRDLKLKIR